MKFQFLLKNCLAAVAVFFVQNLIAHGNHDAPANLKHWAILSENRPVEATFLMSKNDSVFLEKADGSVARFPLADFSGEDQHFIREKVSKIQDLNASRAASQGFRNSENSGSQKTPGVFWGCFLAILALASLLFWRGEILFFQKIGFLGRKPVLAAMLVFSAVLFGFKNEIARTLLGTDPLFVDSAFQPFKPKVATHWDATWFYVESNGIPDHEMMTGIVKWQQQVPIPQCYTGTNAWQIPLNPVLAPVPVPVNDQHFLRGAVAIAANGIAIFNPHTNTGVDAFLDGQLDQWGGHSGRADDYHYHTAPLHLDAQTVDILPIAFALDGFAVYGNLEPDGSPMLPLDSNHGHFDGAGVYHYHGTPDAPYMIGNMVGQVTEDATLQIVPQAKAMPVRPSLTPLSGATITDCTPNATGNGYILTYTRNGQTFKVDYSWTPTGVYTYNFISPTGTTTETYNGHLPCEVPTAVGEITSPENSVVVFPNPNSGSISLKINDLKTSELAGVQIFDAKGSLVFQKEKVGTALEIGGLARGVYFLKIKFEKGEISRKIIVQ